MRRRRPPLRQRSRTLPVLLLGFIAGGVAGFLIHATLAAGLGPPPLLVLDKRIAAPPPDVSPEIPVIGADPVAELRRRTLRLPLDSAHVEAMNGGFAERRGNGARGHEAVDLLAPRETPVRAVEAGTIARLFFSKAGGIAVYQFDSAVEFCYYYAHLERYASGLREGQRVVAGEIIGYVGTSGNAPPDTPHLHFAVFKLADTKRWWEGEAIDPYLVFKP